MGRTRGRRDGGRRSIGMRDWCHSSMRVYRFWAIGGPLVPPMGRVVED